MATLFSAVFCGTGMRAAPPPQELLYPPFATKITCPSTGPYLRLKNGEIFTFRSRHVFISNDDGKSWKSHVVFAKDDPYAFGNGVMLQSQSGAIVLAFSFQSFQGPRFKWNTTTHDTEGDPSAPTYVIRSTDNGRTWSVPQLMHAQWTGANRDILQTRDGRIVFSSMILLHNPGRHATITYSSNDDGLTWKRSNIIDLGGVGNHDGAIEATIEELNDGRIWMLIRTNMDYFWEAFSDDGGQYWRTLKKSNIKGSASPGYLHRLQDGRIMLVWNELYPQGQTTFERWGGDNNWSDIPSSIHRTELACAFSSDEGQTWSKPIVIGKVTKGYFNAKLKWQDISYPYVFEIQPGVLWITSKRGGYAARLLITDLDAQD